MTRQTLSTVCSKCVKQDFVLLIAIEKRNVSKLK
jgi:hypothetical protein